MICLVKPQFEAGRAQVGKNGIVRDEKVRAEVIENVIAYGENNGLAARGVIESPIKGAKGNKEYLLLLKPKEAQ
jgi:23S rRNA (cytidine1920-2'-O)/16S rRNA (cytidine1409-2'-O)-methyltransferase